MSQASLVMSSTSTGGQSKLTLIGLMTSLADMVDFLQKADGVLVATSQALEGEAIKAVREFVNVLPTGVSVNPRAWSGSPLKEEVVKNFLDSRGKHSVVFVSFG